MEALEHEELNGGRSKIHKRIVLGIKGISLAFLEIKHGVKRLRQINK